jgi:serine/threonine protein kinase/Tfp pilus assembly protein PilF
MIGKTVSHYKIIEKLGEGGMGMVYRAEDTRLGRNVALKFLAPEMTRDPEARKRFEHEARAASALDHSNICTLHEIEETDEGRIFIVMSYYQGDSLREKLDRGPLPLKEALDIAIQIGEGLERAHESGITHRDIKPANIIITVRGEVKICDFGLAKLSGVTKLTREGTTLGTVEYMSPEQANGLEVDNRSDIWSLGIVLYHMLTGHSPFRGEYDQSVIYSIINDDPEPVTALRSGLPVEIDRIMTKALAKKPEERYQHVSDLLVDLRTLNQGKESSKGPPKSTAGKGAGHKWIITAAVAVIVIAAALLLRGFLPGERNGKIDSIAVLPLDNISQEQDQEYFVEGMTEALIASLARVENIKVISRTSIMRYKDHSKTIPEIGRDLDVDAIVEGSVMRADGRVRITAQLIEARTDRHLWANSYSRDLRDILALQSEVAGAIAREIKVSVLPKELSSNTVERSIDPSAHEAYLKGRYQWNKRTREGLERSIGYFQEAVSIDPDFVRAHAGLADGYIVLADWGFMLPKDGYARGKEIALRTIELDPTLGEAHASYAATLKLLDYRWEEAESEFQKAIELSPNYATGYQWYGELLMQLGRDEEAITMMKKALELDPLSLMINGTYASVLYYADRYDQSLAQCERTLELDDDFIFVLYLMHSIYVEKGMYEKAVQAAKRLLKTCGAENEIMELTEKKYRNEGVEGYVRFFIREGIDYSGQQYNNPYYKATFYAFLEDYDSAFTHLEKALDAGSMLSCGLRIENMLDPIRKDPRFTAMLQRVGLAEPE